MTWSRFDDAFPQHPKIVGLSDQAFRLHVSAICYANRNLTDGRVPMDALVVLLPGRPRPVLKRRAMELVDAGVWTKTSESAYSIHDFLAYNPTREQVLADRDDL